MKTLDDNEIASWLDKVWQDTLAKSGLDSDPEVDIIQNSGYVSIRYVLITQLLGKFADGSRDALCLQRGSKEGAVEEGRWDPRSFCARIVVPWVQRTDNVLGTSTDPYVSKPLRRPRLDELSIPLKARDEWDRVERVLGKVQDRNDPAFTEQTLRRCLASIARRYLALDIEYSIPSRVGYSQMLAAVESFLATKSRGEVPLIVATAVLRILGNQFGLFDEVKRQGINEPDSPTGSPGDIQCFIWGEQDVRTLILAVEVKDIELRLVDVNATIQKARRQKLADILFVTPGIVTKEASEVKSKFHEEWTKGLNLYQLSLMDLLRVLTPLSGEDIRPVLLKEIGDEINRSASQPALRTAWADVLSATVG